MPEDLLTKARINKISRAIREGFGHCPKCGSRLYDSDIACMKVARVCSTCVSFDETPDRRYQKAIEEAKKKS